MKKFFYIFITLLTFGFAGCQYDDDALWNKVDDLDERVTAVEKKIDAMDQNISLLQQLLGKKLFITSLDNNSDGSYTLHLINYMGEASTKTIRKANAADNGNDGIDDTDNSDNKEGADDQENADNQGDSTPEISVAQGADGVYYWTVNGNYILDSNGNRMPVTGKDGADGKDGITPTFKIENGLWYVSFDHGLTWTTCGKATGEDGDAFFSDASLSDDGNICYLTLADGTVLPFEIYREFNIAFDLSNRFIAYSRTLEVPFTITGGNDKAQVEVIGKNGFEAEVTQNGQTGVIEITAPSATISGKVIVFVSDGADKVLMRTLTFVTGQLNVSTSSFEAAKAGETLEVEVTTDLDFTASFPDDCTWARIANPSRGEVHTETIKIIVDPNESPEARKTVLTLYSDATPIETILISQKGSEYPADRLVFRVQPELEAEDMIGMAQIPIYNSTGEIHIDWGDGTVETVEASLTNTTNRRKAFAHIYADASKQYEVQVWCGSGAKITQLDHSMGQATNADGKNVSSVCDSTLTEVIQWGNAGTLTSIKLGCDNLRKVNVPHPDAFKAVTALDFKVMYLDRSTQLTSIPEGFLDGAVKLASAEGMFYGCHYLKTVPEDLFAKCVSLNNVRNLFYNCYSLERGIKVSYVEKQLRNIQQVYYCCTSLKSIPANAFPQQLSSNPTCNGVFYGCESLEEVTADNFLWLDNEKDAKIQNVGSMFYNCKSLKKVDLSFLNRIPKAYGFRAMFQNCENLEVEIPTYPLTLDDGTTVEVKLWERASDEYKSYFANRNYDASDCFTGAVKVVGYNNQIPTSWGGLWDGTGGEPTVEIEPTLLKGHEYYTVDFKVKTTNIVKLQYFLADKENMERALKLYNSSYEELVIAEGQTIDSKYYDEAKTIAMLNSDEGYTFRFDAGDPQQEYTFAVVGFNYLGTAVDAATIVTNPMPKGSDAYESYVGRWRVKATSSISDYIEYEPVPVEFEVVIEPYRVDSVFAVSGWGMTTINDENHHIAFHFEPEKGNVMTTYLGRKMMLPDWYDRYQHKDPKHPLFELWSVGTGFYADYGEDGIGLLSPSTPEQTMQAKTDGSNGKFVMDGIMSAYQGAWAIKYIGFDFMFGMGSGPSTSDQFFPRLLVKPEFAAHATYKGEQHFPMSVAPYTFELITREIPNTIFPEPSKARRHSKASASKDKIQGIKLDINKSSKESDVFDFSKIVKKLKFVDTRR